MQIAVANPSFIARSMGHEDARMVCEVYSTWIGDMTQDQVSLRNNQMPTALLQGLSQGRGLIKKSFNFIVLVSTYIISVKLFIP